MLIPVISTLRVEDFPSEKDWIDKLLFPINSFLLSATTALNGNVTYSDNIPCQLITMNFVYSSPSDFPKTFAWSLSTNSNLSTPLNPTELRVCSATENSAAVILIPAWSFSNGTISISYFSKLPSSAVASGTTLAPLPLTVGATYNIVMRGQP